VLQGIGVVFVSSTGVKPTKIIFEENFWVSLINF